MTHAPSQALTFASTTENQTNRKQNKMRRHKSDSVNQYGQGDSTVCVTSAAWRRKHGVTKKDVTLFIGAAYGEVSRKFAASILRQFRRDTAENRGKNDRGF
jgi:hypothetical protein